MTPRLASVTEIPDDGWRRQRALEAQPQEKDMRGATVYVPSQADMAFVTELQAELGSPYTLTFDVQIDGGLRITARTAGRLVDGYTVITYPQQFLQEAVTALAQTIREELS